MRKKVIEKIALATILIFSLGLTACGVDEKNESKHEENTIVHESIKETSTSEKENNIKEFQVDVPVGYIEKNSGYVNISDESKTITVKKSQKKSQNEIDSAKGISLQELARVKGPDSSFLDYKKEVLNGYTCYLVMTREMTKVFLDQNEKYLVTIDFNGIMYEDDEFKSFMNSFKALD